MLLKINKAYEFDQVKNKYFLFFNGWTQKNLL